jgi:hypothetical protein
LAWWGMRRYRVSTALSLGLLPVFLFIGLRLTANR